jgi:hypothetical protein
MATVAYTIVVVNDDSRSINDTFRSVKDTSRSIIGDSRVMLLIVESLMSVIYNHNMLKVQATGVCIIKLFSLGRKICNVYPWQNFSA